MYGSKEEFTYFQCLNCDCLQIGEIPADISPYYPSNYYSLSTLTPVRQGALRRTLNRLRTDHALKPRLGLGSLVRRCFGPPQLPQYFTRIKLQRTSPVLDVGCGSGSFLEGLHRLGFTNLTGIDPYIPQDSSPLPGLRILKGELQRLTDSYDLIVLNHSFEHMEAQVSVLETLRQRLGVGGSLVIRIPICSSHAWREYGPDWVQLDAPRHFFLHSVKSMGLLAEKTGFRIESVSYDSWEFQFWGSEQYRQDIPLLDERSWNNGPEKSIFKPEQIEAFKQHSQQLNEEGLGDQACFILRRLERN